MNQDVENLDGFLLSDKYCKISGQESQQLQTCNAIKPDKARKPP